MLAVSVSSSVEHGFSVFFGWIPHLLGALVVLLIGYIVAKIAGKVCAAATRRGGLDRALHAGPGGNVIQRVLAKPSMFVGTIVFWAIVLATLSLAASVLGIAALTAFIGAVFAYLPNVIAAILIFLIAGLVSAAVATLATRAMGTGGFGKIVATAAPILIMTIATFMILDQLRIAHNIVVITYAALLGAVALGSALAFGLGGREVAAQLLQGAYQTGKDNKEQWKHDLDGGADHAKQQVHDLKARAADASTATT